MAVDPSVAITTLDDALALWRGPALADLTDRPSLLAEAARLDELRFEAQQERIEGLIAGGHDARAAGELETLVVQFPLREGLWELLMLALYRDGRQADALNAYQRAREILADQLGIDPSAELARLHERILQQDPGLELKGEPLRGYRLLEKLGDGPDGVVFRAIQPHVGRDVAVKVFRESVAADPAFVRRFEPDAQTAAALEHPHIVPTYDAWREPGRAYVASRYLRGGSLRALDARGDRLGRDRADPGRRADHLGAGVRAPPRCHARRPERCQRPLRRRGQRLPRRLPPPFGRRRRRARRRPIARRPPVEAAGPTHAGTPRGRRGTRGRRDRCERCRLVPRLHPGDAPAVRRSRPTYEPMPGTRTRDCAPSPRPTPATSLAGRPWSDVSWRGSGRRSPALGSWRSWDRAAVASPRWCGRGSSPRSVAACSTGQVTGISLRCSPARIRSTNLKRHCSGSRSAPHHVSATPSSPVPVASSMPSIWSCPATPKSCSSSISSRNSSRSPRANATGS